MHQDGFKLQTRSQSVTVDNTSSANPEPSSGTRTVLQAGFATNVAPAGRTSSKWFVAPCKTFSATLPRSQRCIPEYPCVAMAIRASGCPATRSTIASAGFPSSIVNLTSVIPEKEAAIFSKY